MIKINFLFILIGVVALTGCTTSSLQVLGGYQPAQLDAMNYYDWALTATPEMAATEQVQLERRIEASNSEESLVQLALLLSVAGASAEKDEEALALLTKFAERATVSAVDSEYQLFASLWTEVLVLRQQLREQAANQSVGRQRIVDLERESAALKEQIEALMSIEQQLDGRGQIRGN